MNLASLRAYLVPGLVFQSVIVGGGYATGRELVEFFMSTGPVAGLLGLATAACAISLIMAAAYEFARVTGSYDYRSFCRVLLGPAWMIYEVVYLATVILVLAVIGAAAGEFAHSVLSLPPLAGTLALAALIGVLAFHGSDLIARVLSAWSLLLYLTYVLLFVLVYQAYAQQIGEALQEPVADGAWPLAGLRYTGYNLALPSVLFCVTYLSTRRQALGAGALTGVIAIAPASLFFIAMLALWPAILEEPVPAVTLIQSLNAPLLQSLFLFMVFGTFVETGIGLLHAINERIANQLAEQDRPLSRQHRSLIALGILLASVFIAQGIGIVDLIARGYTALSALMFTVLVVPLLTRGLWLIRRR